MERGIIRFCCKKDNCPTRIRIAKILYEYCKVCIAFKEKCQFQVNLTAFGFDSETIDSFTDYFRWNGDRSQMKVDPRISRDFRRDGDESVNIFQTYE